MSKINRTVIAIAVALLTLFMVLPTVSTASADDYSHDGGNGAAQAAAYVVGGVSAVGIILVLAGHKKSGSDMSGS